MLNVIIIGHKFNGMLNERKEVNTLAREWMKKKREEKSMTMKEMAAKLDITEAYYSYIESGARQKVMDISLAAKLADIFSLSVQQIVELEAE